MSNLATPHESRPDYPDQSVCNLVRIALGRGIDVRIQLSDGSLFDVEAPVIVSPQAIQFANHKIDQLMTVRLDEIIAVQSRRDNRLAA